MDTVNHSTIQYVSGTANERSQRISLVYKNNRKI